MTEKNKEIIVCPSCSALNSRLEKFCHNCRAVLPKQKGYSDETKRDKEGFFGESTSKRPKFIILLGSWVFLLPSIVGLILSGILLISDWDGLPSLILLVTGIALLLLFVKMLINVTKNYLTIPEKPIVAKKNRSRRRKKLSNF